MPFSRVRRISRAVVKALGQVEQLVRELSPGFDLLEQARPFVREIHARRVHPRRGLREFLNFGGGAGHGIAHAAARASPSGRAHAMAAFRA